MALTVNTYLGNPCTHGHGGLRYKKNRTCVECSRLLGQNWRDNNRTKSRACDYKAARKTSRHYHHLLWNAQKRSIDVQITQEEFMQIVASPCFYCGGALPDAGSGIDRIDNTLGYIPGNCRPCCTACNLAKREMSEEEFRAWVERVYNHYVRIR